MKTDLTHNGKKITVLRAFGRVTRYLVVQGDSWYGKGLNEKYKEFDCYNDAYNYFLTIQE